MRAMTDTVIDLPDSKPDDKVIKPDINTDKSKINQNKPDKSDLSDLYLIYSALNIQHNYVCSL